ncbi:ribose-phosphate diphosphokinase [Entomospira culicis]|uniref:ribose-phosphate diphosphokinase n=1 Tax=Entomospira culicis TaxID=2719989 RepID=A0A968GG86_9SPIO|nr:ribose-phosphate diphosphokinase [Entomospira culicis]NIZ19787.1 ribose-phosphate diphosphokinase [Entomospira culicis]NIZ70001.1 ribose-phosphate diphosphokinase [Entomospira culicis]WDI37106.1 ribose-phosphate diphosphokinase [Entomospira culicis]WDI38735.1 ribose-phosphate diphosphokinase [Entomospira culicis]
MGTFNSVPLGIVVCPGAETFSAQLIHFVEQFWRHRFLRKCKSIANTYGFEEEFALKILNLSDDLMTARISPRGSAEKFRMPRFKVDATFTCFANGEVKTELLGSVRERDIYIIQDMYSKVPAHYEGADPKVYAVNDHYMTLLTAVDAAKGAGAGRITCILPAYPYARQHKRKGREGLTAALVGRILEDMGVDRIITLDIHSRDIDHTFKNLHLESFHANYPILKALKQIINLKEEDLVVLAPDTGSLGRNRYYANSLGRPLAMMYKERDYSKVSKNASDSNIKGAKLLGDVAGKTVFLADDMLGTGGTLIKALEQMRENGAKRVIIAISLPFFDADAVEQFQKAYDAGLFWRLISTNAVAHSSDLLERSWYIQADVAKLFAEVLMRLHTDRTLSPLLDNNEVIQKLLNAEDE